MKLPELPKLTITKELEPKDFLSFEKRNRDRIKRTKLILPKLGENSFGKIVVEYK